MRDLLSFALPNQTCSFVHLLPKSAFVNRCSIFNSTLHFLRMTKLLNGKEKLLREDQKHTLPAIECRVFRAQARSNGVGAKSRVR